MIEAERLQDNLLLIRRAVGWNATELGDNIGVSRQTINNLETKRCSLSKAQYIAIRSVLEAEIAKSPEDTQMLKYILEIFIDNPDKYNQKAREELLAKANMITPSILAGTSTRAEVSKEFVGVVTAMKIFAKVMASLPPTPGIGFFASSLPWLVKAINDKTKT